MSLLWKRSLPQRHLCEGKACETDVDGIKICHGAIQFRGGSNENIGVVFREFQTWYKNSYSRSSCPARKDLLKYFKQNGYQINKTKTRLLGWSWMETAGSDDEGELADGLEI